jgi:hypothetical protein
VFNNKKKETKPQAVETMSRGEWMQKYWRPCAAFMYMACCLCDFAIFPIMFTVVQFWEEQASNDAFRQWVPITLQGGGLFHVSMCAVLGVSAYGRTQEKLAGQSAVPAGLPSPELGASNGQSSITQQPAPSVSAPAGNFGSSNSGAAPSAPGVGSSTNTASSGAPSSFGSAPATPAFGAVTTAKSGKPGPAQPDHPEI